MNVPLEEGRITDDFRILAFLPTLERILERGGTVVVCSHLGRPKGPDPEYTLAPVAAALSDALAGDVPLVFDYDKVPEVRVALLENLRFNEGETKNDPAVGARRRVRERRLRLVPPGARIDRRPAFEAAVGGRTALGA